MLANIREYAPITVVVGEEGREGQGKLKGDVWRIGMIRFRRTTRSSSLQDGAHDGAPLSLRAKRVDGHASGSSQGGGTRCGHDIGAQEGAPCDHLLHHEVHRRRRREHRRGPHDGGNKSSTDKRKVRQKMHEPGRGEGVCTE